MRWGVTCRLSGRRRRMWAVLFATNPHSADHRSAVAVAGPEAVSGRQTKPREFEGVHKTHLLQLSLWLLPYLYLFFFHLILCSLFSVLVFIPPPSFSCPLLNWESFLHLPPPPTVFSPCGSLENRPYFYFYSGYPGVRRCLMTYIYLTTHFSIRFKSHSVFLSSSKTWHRL